MLIDNSNLINPSPLMRPAPFWSWNDKLDESELRRQIREMAEKGWGSYFMHSRVGLVTGYLSDEWMRLVNACVDEAAKTGTYAWIYDEDKWPSGFAGGEIPEKDEKYRSRQLVLLKRGTAGPNDTVLADVTFAGVNYDICKRVSALDSAWFNGASYVDLMNPEAVREFIACTHERYKVACGEHFGKTIPGVFTDEPCYLMHNSQTVPTVPWSDYLPDFFREVKGYDITQHLPLLFFEMDNYRKIRFDFYDAATELFKRSFTKQYYDWCQANGLILTGHFMAEDGLCYQTQWSGDVMSHYEFMNWPGIDKLSRHIEQIVTCTQLSSADDQLGKERAFSEVFGCMGGQCSFFHRKWIGDWQAALGISFVNHHLSLYSMRGERKRDYPANLFYQQPWWDDERGFADYQARLCAAVSEGERMVDILVIQPLASVWSEYSPLHKISGYAAENTYDVPFDQISRKLMAGKLDYHYGNENLMAGHASIDGGRITVGRHSYGCVIVPPALNIKSTTAKLLSDYARGGGLLIFVGSIPSMVDGVETAMEYPGATVVRDLDEAVAVADKTFSERIRVTDVLTGRNAASVYVHSRRVNGSTRHLFVNTNELREVRVIVSLPASIGSDTAVFDLWDGNQQALDTQDGKFEIELAPAGSFLLICGEEAPEASKAARAFLGSGAIFASFAKSAPDALIDDLDCEILDENVLLLNDFKLEMDGKPAYEGPVCGAWHKHFYPAPEGTSFKAIYTFISECEVDGCAAAIEVAENLDSITFNGERVRALKSRGEMGAFDPSRSWLDVNFTRVPLPMLRKGVNTLVIEGRKSNNITGPNCHVRVRDWKDHQPTEAEEAYILGRFAVKQLSDGLYTIAPFQKPAGKNLNLEGFPFYCGRIALRGSFEMNDAPRGKVFLKLNNAMLSSAEVAVNDQPCATVYWEPYVVDITGAVNPGENSIEINAATTLVNAFGPNRIANIKKQEGIGPHSFVMMEELTSRYVLFDFGIGGVGIYQMP